MGSRITRPSDALVACLTAVVSLALLPGIAEAYNQWSVNDDATNCRQCHGDFRAGPYVSLADGDPWPNSLHNVHRNTMLDEFCSACHFGANRFPVFLNLSNGGEGLQPVSCVGCHGIDPNPGSSNNQWGAGLRRHHVLALVPPDQNGDTCFDCHQNDPTPMAENVPPSYYFTPDPSHPDKPTDPCNPSPNFVEHFSQGTMGTEGLDNDGDLIYDEVDSDCGGLLILLDGLESGGTFAWSATVP